MRAAGWNASPEMLRLCLGAGAGCAARKREDVLQSIEATSALIYQEALKGLAPERVFERETAARVLGLLVRPSDARQRHGLRRGCSRAPAAVDSHPLALVLDLHQKVALPCPRRAVSRCSGCRCATLASSEVCVVRLASSSVMWLTLLVMTFAIAQEALVQEYEGNGALNTRPFTVVPGWEIQWDASGDIFQLYLHDGAGDLIGVAANQMGPGRGASYQPRAGTYYLQVNALGRWSIRIVSIN